MKSFEELEAGCKYNLRDVSNVYPEYAMPIGANDSVRLLAYFHNGEVFMTDYDHPDFKGGNK